MPSFIVYGGKKLKGAVKIEGSKNAALPILAATLLTNDQCVIKNVPDIDDVHSMLKILDSLGSETHFKNNTVTVRSGVKKTRPMPEDVVCKMRASVLLLGPLLARFGFVKSPYPGGCVLGARAIDTHIDVFTQYGVKEIGASKDQIVLKGKPHAADIVLPEFSVTATENALMAAVFAPGTTTIRLAAVEPHVQDLARFLLAMGARITGIGTHTLTVKGVKKLHGSQYSVTPDYLEAGTFILAAVLTKGDVVVKNVNPHDLDAFFNLLKEMGVSFQISGRQVRIKPSLKITACKRLQTNVFPGFPTDLQAPFVILLTQASGISTVHEALFEGRFKYLPELTKMGAKVQTANPHETFITGPSQLKGATVKSWDIRAGAAMILAALVAKGRTTVTDIQYIDRGYERFDEKLRRLGARIERKES